MLGAPPLCAPARVIPGRTLLGVKVGSAPIPSLNFKLRPEAVGGGSAEVPLPVHLWVTAHQPTLTPASLAPGSRSDSRSRAAVGSSARGSRGSGTSGPDLEPSSSSPKGGMHVGLCDSLVEQ
jgi:hypothetical protein